MLETFRKTWDLLDARERRNSLILMGLVLIMGISDAAGVASLMPFLSVLSDPAQIQEKAYLEALYNGLGFTDQRPFLLFLGGGVFVAVVAGLTIKALTFWALARFANMRNYTLSIRLLRGYLGRPYSWFLTRHSADLGKTVLSEVQQVISHALVPTLRMVAQLVSVAFLFGLVFWIEPWVATLVVLVLGGSYAAIYGILRSYLGHIGADRLKANEERFQIAEEALGGIKEVKSAGLEAGYVRSFKNPARRFARHQAANQILGEVPRYILEALTIGSMLVVILVLLAARGGQVQEVIPSMGVFAFAAIRLLPALQQVYRYAVKLRFGRPALDALHADLLASEGGIDPSKGSPDSFEPLHLRRRLELAGIKYSYPGAGKPAIKDLGLTIPANSTVGFVGSTGAGKTTVVDLILGLLKPDEGQILVDDTPLSPDNIRSWQKAIGYVPQQIFLADDSVAVNIAFGVAPGEIDHAAVERAARIAELHDFVVSEMPHGYETRVGERGVRLSGGQRQRIGIARALYHDPDLLVLDEATSALDNVTERAVMEAVNDLYKQKTIILIAHRLSTVRECDQIFLLSEGEVAAQGTYDELVARNEKFRAMAR